MTLRLRTLGFWFDERAPNAYPRPQALVGGWDPAARRAVLAYLRRGAVFERYGAWSHCRFACGAPRRAMGRCDLSDGAWAWPEGLAHYVEAHDVRLPAAFVRRAVARRRAARPAGGWAAREGLLDDGPWLRWGQARGACVDLAGWLVPGWRQRAAFAAVLAAGGVGGDVLLVDAQPGRRVRGREAIVWRRGLWRVRVGPRRVLTSWIGGWADWPGR